jgi:hypothetical protein
MKEIPVRECWTDRIARRLAARQAPRRQLLAVGTGMIVAGAMPWLGRSRIAARSATPIASPAADEAPSLLFVQTAASGNFEAATDGVDRVLLTLEGVPARTTYFADRPSRAAGAIPTETFLAEIGFGDDPPNAALVTQTGDGQVVVLLELLSGRLEDGPGGLRLLYETRPLDGDPGGALTTFAPRQSPGTLPAEFGEASLFIDDIIWPYQSSPVVCQGPDGSTLGDTYSVDFGIGFYAPNDATQECLRPMSDAYPDYLAQSWYDRLCAEPFPDTCGEPQTCTLAVLSNPRGLPWCDRKTA